MLAGLYGLLARKWTTVIYSTSDREGGTTTSSYVQPWIGAQYANLTSHVGEKYCASYRSPFDDIMVNMKI